MTRCTLNGIDGRRRYATAGNSRRLELRTIARVCEESVTDLARQLLIMRWPGSPSVHKLALVAPIRKGALSVTRRCAFVVSDR
jgi:hypothetical protein